MTSINLSVGTTSMVVTADRGLLVHCTPRGDIYLQANIARPQPQPQLLRDQCVGQHTANGSAVQKSMNAKANSPNRKATIEEGEAFSAMNSCAPRAADCQRQLDKSAKDGSRANEMLATTSHTTTTRSSCELLRARRRRVCVRC